ncbi:hypothetical protein [Arthrobacter sp. Alg241-R88]|uniref:hypothetical protein n=1 Tax=Arthrobacter sp. Alg241-R88 TaxID=2305984 RepID=UPI0013CF8267|nr:hypothetical protein [Arthrobacter sp. Alg241-R88]
MEQPGRAIEFREVDQDGNQVPEAVRSGAGEGSASSPAPAVNPFIVALWLLAILLIGGGALIFLNANTMVGPTTSGMPASFLMFTFAPYAIVAGLAAAICLLFWHAFQWQRRHG